MWSNASSNYIESKSKSLIPTIVVFSKIKNCQQKTDINTKMTNSRNFLRRNIFLPKLFHKTSKSALNVTESSDANLVQETTNSNNNTETSNQNYRLFIQAFYLLKRIILCKEVNNTKSAQTIDQVLIFFNIFVNYFIFFILFCLK